MKIASCTTVPLYAPNEQSKTQNAASSLIDKVKALWSRLLEWICGLFCKTKDSTAVSSESKNEPKLISLQKNPEPTTEMQPSAKSTAKEKQAVVSLTNNAAKKGIPKRIQLFAERPKISAKETPNKPLSLEEQWNQKISKHFPDAPKSLLEELSSLSAHERYDKLSRYRIERIYPKQETLYAPEAGSWRAGLTPLDIPYYRGQTVADFINTISKMTGFPSDKIRIWGSVAYRKEGGISLASYLLNDEDKIDNSVPDIVNMVGAPRFQVLVPPIPRIAYMIVE